ncbi:MAG: hypothetical protein KBC21_03730 [Candidatus Pacebacteria bacterium]|nr:hypothetical protein [Candidatus Paceibacterota bacterium]
MHIEIISSEKVDMAKYGHISTCHVHCVHAKVTNLHERAKEMVRTISDTSWISKLDTVGKVTFEATSERTIKKLVEDIISKVSDEPTREFGEYMISLGALDLLESGHQHTKVPLAELLKDKIIGNPGFDFHTESTKNNIIFGEAKYSGTITPRADALDQIAKFIQLKKDSADLNVLQHFVTPVAVSNFTEKNKRGYVAAFSLNSPDVTLIFKNALESKVVTELIDHEELYLIAIEICQ